MFYLCMPLGGKCTDTQMYVIFVYALIYTNVQKHTYLPKTLNKGVKQIYTSEGILNHWLISEMLHKNRKL